MKRKISKKTKRLSRGPADGGLRLAAVGTLEVVIIIAVLLAVALLFRTEITSFAESLFENAFNTNYVELLRPEANK
ncbi:MAG: hypothetical protein GX034_06985 [Clostridiaceae bacterium]|jgi:hypothetical protein|nr:hypothetical protein [Clostridiaceae bacterium]